MIFKHFEALSVERAVDGDIIVECPVCGGWHRAPLNIVGERVVFRAFDASGQMIRARLDQGSAYATNQSRVSICVNCGEGEHLYDKHVMLDIPIIRVRELLERR